MKTSKLIATLSLVIFLSNQSNAQVTLPYFSGFDNTEQQNDWIEYRTASNQFNSWGYSSTDAYSDPNCISHSYAPSTGVTLTDDWYVSPGFSIANGGKLDSIRYKFSGFSVPEIGDTIAIYLLSGSADPASATSKTLLFDFRGDEYLTDNTYRMQSDIPLAASSELSYLAIRYRSTDFSSKWLTVFFDNIAISGSTVGFNEFDNNDAISVYPNPSIDGKFIVNFSNKPKSILVLNSIGQVVENLAIIDNEKVEIDLSNQVKGIYLIVTDNGGERITKKIIYK